MRIRRKPIHSVSILSVAGFIFCPAVLLLYISLSAGPPKKSNRHSYLLWRKYNLGFPTQNMVLNWS